MPDKFYRLSCYNVFMDGTSEQPPKPPPIDSLSEQELRQEVIERIDNTLGELPIGPVADGSALNGYNRTKQNLSSLRCSYFQFSKASNGETQAGIQIALLGCSIYHHLISIFIKQNWKSA